MKPILSLIAAVAENQAIGKDNDLLFHLPDDLKRFKALTKGHTVIMGRKTFDSLPNGALPLRRNIVLTHNENWSSPSCEKASSIEEAIFLCQEEEEIFIIGGASLYQSTLTIADRLYLTSIHAYPEADAFFPTIDPTQWRETFSQSHDTDEKHSVPFTFINYEKVPTLFL